MDTTLPRNNEKHNFVTSEPFYAAFDMCKLQMIKQKQRCNIFIMQTRYLQQVSMQTEKWVKHQQYPCNEGLLKVKHTDKIQTGLTQCQLQSRTTRAKHWVQLLQIHKLNPNIIIKTKTYIPLRNKATFKF